MSYSICGLIVPQREDRICSERMWPLVRLTAGVSLLPLERDHLLLTEGDDTQPNAFAEFSIPQWLSDLVRDFTRSAYIEAEFWGGTGTQASVVFEQGRVLSGPEISAHAINSALRQLGVTDGPSITFLSLPVTTGRDPFDMVGLGRHRSVSGWLRENQQRRDRLTIN